MYDAIIIGAGAAGAHISSLLSQKGFHILLFEKFKLPREKLCAGGLSMKTVALLKFDLSPVIKQKINTLRFGFGGKQEIVYKNDTPIVFTVARKEFDFYLLNQSKDIEIKQATRVDKLILNSNENIVVTKDGKEYRARYIIIASGALDNIARQVDGIRIKKYRAFGVEFFAHHPNPTPEIYIDFGMPENGYSWIFPRGDGYMIGCGNAYGNERGLKDALLRFLQLKKEYDFGHNENIRGHPIDSVGNHKPILATKNVFVIGEAGGLVDALTGEGIYYALLSAQILSEILLGNDSDEIKVRNYNRRIKKEIWREIKYSYRLSRFANKNKVFAYRLIYKKEALRKLFFRVFQGELKYSEAFNRKFILKRLLQIWKIKSNH